MENYSEAAAVLEAALAKAQKGFGSTVLIRGEGGIGKSFLFKQFISLHENDCFLVQAKGLPVSHGALSSIYESLFDLASQRHVSKSMYVSLLSRYTKLLPGFGQYVAPLVELLKSDALQEIIARSGIAIGTAPVVHVIRFVKELAEKQTVLWIIDDAQWVDSDSWSSFVHIVSKANMLGWCVVMGLNDKTQQWQSEGVAIDQALGYWEEHANEISWTCISAKRWTAENLPTLCGKILGQPCVLGKLELEQLHNYTSGIPLYVASVLDVLKNDKRLVLRDNAWTSSAHWQKLDVGLPIREALDKRLKAVYRTIPQSRESLEMASVIGQIFDEETINGISSSANRYEQLSEIEERFRIIEYIVQNRHWTFDHNLIRESIYRSLGSRAKHIHLQLAKFLEGNKDVSPLAVSFHYEQAGQFDDAVRFKLREAQRLLGIGLFRSALALVDNVRGIISGRNLQLSSDLSIDVVTLHGRLLFHTRQYQEALNLFLSLLQKAKTRDEEAIFHRWTGRCLLKLHRQEDFIQSVDHLSLAATLCKDRGDLSAEGDAYTDLVVAYAHLNDFHRAEQSFKKAEVCFNQARDQLGMARLQRRNVIFMQSELAAPILEQLAHSFEAWGVPHEVVMSLNNAATEYLYLGHYKKAARLLADALQASVEIGDFGIAYIYCNLAITHIVQGQLEQGRECIRQARTGRLRAVEELILDSADGVLVAMTSGLETGKTTFSRALAIAEITGEEAYILPLKINLAHCLHGLGQMKEAIAILESATPRTRTGFSSYNCRRWFRLLASCYSDTGQEAERHKLETDSAWCDVSHSFSTYHDFPFAFIDMQFWSD